MLNLSEYKNGCSHYKRKCSIVCKECNEPFICRICHDNEKYDDEMDIKKAHKIDRFTIEEIVCLKCNTQQNISNKCIKCNVQFGNYYCSICHLFDDENKGQYHCSKCGFCRVGGKDNFNHCDTCNMCINKNIEHKCKSEQYNIDCAFCYEDLYTSVDTSMQVKCGHIFHKKCFFENLKQNNYKCPLCFKSMIDMTNINRFYDREIQNTIIPEEYKNKELDIFCNECEKYSKCKFHIVALKCSNCNGYNTRRI